MTWVHGADGYDLLFNRDERNERAPELPASELEANGVRWLAPRDGDFGGTWIAVNEFGLTVALLNNYADSLGAEPAEWTSRGELVTRLAEAVSVADARERLASYDLSVFRPFVIVGLESGQPATVARWDGREFLVDANADGDMPLISSGVKLEEVRRHRRAVFRDLTRDGVTVEVLDAFHRSHAGGPSELSTCMHREDASTRSLCHISVRGGSVRLEHTPGASCEAKPAPALSLTRRLPVAG